MQQEEFKQLTDKLAALGEDKAELEMWSKIFQDLEPVEQDELVKNLQKELTDLEQLIKD